VLNADQYYRRAPHSSIREYSNLSFFEEHILPVRMDGLWIMGVVLGVRCLVTGLTLGVMIFRRRSDRRNEAKLEMGCVRKERIL
jgi:hypothetical protein